MLHTLTVTLRKQQEQQTILDGALLELRQTTPSLNEHLQLQNDRLKKIQEIVHTLEAQFAKINTAIAGLMRNTKNFDEIYGEMENMVAVINECLSELARIDTQQHQQYQQYQQQQQYQQYQQQQQHQQYQQQQQPQQPQQQQQYQQQQKHSLKRDEVEQPYSKRMRSGGSRSRRRHSLPKSSRKYNKSSNRVFRKKSRSTKRR